MASAMASQLWLLRHADAERHGVRADSERRLTERGELQARAAGLALAALGVHFDAVLCSPKVRARQTAQIAAGEWDEATRPRVEVHQPLATGFDAAAARGALVGVGAAAHVLLVGHEPDLSGVIAQLTGARVELKKGGLALIRLEAGGAQLALLMRPRELALIADGGGIANRGGLSDLVGSPGSG